VPRTIADIERLETIATAIERLVNVATRSEFTGSAIEDLAEAAVPLLRSEEHGEFQTACAAVLWEPSGEHWSTLAGFAKRFRKRATHARRRIARP
jgi:hypothetical protein